MMSLFVALVLGMALNFKRSNTAVNEEADRIATLLNNGYLRIYDGTQPATADTGLSGNTLLAELRFNATAFAAASGGVAVANAFTSDSSANATGTASFFRAFKSDGTTVIFDGSVGVSGCNLNLNSVSIATGLEVEVDSMTYTANKG